MTASGVSIFKINFGFFLYFLKMVLINLRSFVFRKKLHPTRSACLAIKGIDFKSALVSAGKLIWVSGRFNPFSLFI